MPIDLAQETSPIDPNNPKYEKMLAQLQGNVLKSHGRNRAVHLFLRFTGEEQKIRSWLAAFTNRFVTSALRQHYETKEYKTNQISGRTFANLLLSSAGYAKLGFDLDKFEESRELFSAETTFKDGLKAARAVLSDPPAGEWDKGYRGRIDALVILADEDEDRLGDVVKRVEKSIKGAAKIVAREDGLGLRDKANKPLEHFGYRDGISQPLYYQADVSEESAMGLDKWNPSAALDLVLVKDPFAPPTAEDCFGSYFVFRKLEQNVKAFKEREEELAAALKLSAAQEERAGALVVGRFENGIPVTLSATETDDGLKDFNNFNYAGDAKGNKCPFHAHIRKTNPRGDTGFEPDGQVSTEEMRRRVTRRGITYGERELDDTTGRPTMKDRPSKDVGLLFQCFQSSIPMQFGFMQAIWSNNPDFRNQETGIDPVIGQSSTNGGALKFPPKYDRENRTEFDFQGFVTMKGGEYFFAPSIAFLLALDDEVAPQAVKLDQAEFAAQGIRNG